MTVQTITAGKRISRRQRVGFVYRNEVLFSVPSHNLKVITYERILSRSFFMVDIVRGYIYAAHTARNHVCGIVLVWQAHNQTWV